jgi:hypothetical protein
MESSFLDELRNLNYSNQMDSGEHQWAALCNLLGDFAENVSTVEDLPAHDRRVANEGFGNDSELCRHMVERITDQAAKLMYLAQKLRLLSAMYMVREYARGK